MTASDFCTSVVEGLEVFHPRGAGHVFEIRIPVGRGVHAGFFTDLDLAAAAIERAEERYRHNIYCSLNPVSSALLGRVGNRLIERASKLTTDEQVVRRLRLLIDCDAVRPAGTAATGGELQAALAKRDAVVAWLSSAYAWPDPILIISGNGGHAIYAIDLAVGDESDQLVKDVLRALDARHSDAAVTIDTTVANASRITKVPGTWSRKGEDTVDRPHRRAALELVPDHFVPVTLEQLRAVAALAPANGNGQRPTAGPRSPSRAVDPDTAVRRARAYVEKMDAAIDGQHGNEQTYKAACVLVKDFGLGDGDASDLLREFNARCVPPWSERELQDFLDHARQYGNGSTGAKLGEDRRRPSAGGDSETTTETTPGAAPSTPVLDPSDPLPGARVYVAQYQSLDGRVALHHQGGVFYVFRPAVNAYMELDEAAVRAALYGFLDGAQRWGEPKPGQAPKLTPFKPTRAKVENVLDALRAACNLPVTAAAPCWVHDDPGLDPYDMLACANGLLHIPTRTLLPATADFFTLQGVDFSYDPAAAVPVGWHTFLDALWPEDRASQETLQEWFGYVLTPRTHFQKALLVVGPLRSGKGTVARVSRRLLGERHVCGPTVASLNEQFGLAGLIGKSLAIISDARIGGHADTAILAERLLAISGEDALSIPRKFLPDWTGMLPTRFWVLTNELPRIEDSSGALASRFIVLRLTESFLGREDHQLLDRLVPELPGILLWALEGFDRLYSRGRFVQPASSDDLIEQFQDLGSPIRAFLRDRCQVGKGFEVAKDRLFSAWKSWCQESGRERSGTIQTFGRNLRSAVPWLGESRPHVLGARVRYFEGVCLQDGAE